MGCATGYQAIVFKRAAELTIIKGFRYFYILDDKGNTSSNLVAWANQYSAGLTEVHRHTFQITIQMTENTDGVDAQEMFAKYKNIK